MATGRKLRISSEFTGDGFPTADGGDGPLTLATGGIASTKLADSGVTAGSYTNANITVNAKGLVTSASNGSGGSGSGAPSYTQLTAGSATLDIEYTGSTAPTSFAETPAGTFTLTVPTGTVLRSATFVGGSGTVTGANQMTIKFVDTDGRSIHFVAALLRLDTYQEIGLALSGINPTQDNSVAGTVTSIWQNLNYPNFQINLAFVNKKVPA